MSFCASVSKIVDAHIAAWGKNLALEGKARCWLRRVRGSRWPGSDCNRLVPIGGRDSGSQIGGSDRVERRFSVRQPNGQREDIGNYQAREKNDQDSNRATRHDQI